MSHFVRERSVGPAVLSAALFAIMAVHARADAINFEALGSQQVASLTLDGVTISGSNDVVVDLNSGLGIRGGLASIGPGDYFIDPTESVTFHFDRAAATNIVVSWQYVGAFGNVPYTSGGESVITAFGPTGNLLGTEVLTPQLSPLVPFNISAAFDNQPISSFSLQPVGDSVNGATVSLSELTFTVLEPASAVGWAAGALVLLGVASKRQNRRPTAGTTSLEAVSIQARWRCRTCLGSMTLVARPRRLSTTITQ
jgi:hypothetical protein